MGDTVVTTRLGHGFSWQGEVASLRQESSRLANAVHMQDGDVTLDFGWKEERGTSQSSVESKHIFLLRMAKQILQRPQGRTVLRKCT
jgi:hypothetical protein